MHIMLNTEHTMLNWTQTQVVLDLDGLQVLEDHAGNKPDHSTLDRDPDNETWNPPHQTLNTYNIK